MTVYSFVLSLHVVTAVLGLGPLAAVTLLTGADTPVPLASLQRIIRVVIGSLAVMFVTGCVLAGLVRGAYEHAWWLRVSVLLFLFLGFLHSRVRRALRGAEPARDPSVTRRVHRILQAMCVVIGVITWLMEAKPW